MVSEMDNVYTLTSSHYHNLNKVATMDERYDLFIAYHGTNDSRGSLEKAKEIFFYLEPRGIKCYLFVTTDSSYFGETPQFVAKSGKFLLVCNQNIGIASDGSIINNGVAQEIKVFYNMIYANNRRDGDARVFAYDGLSAKAANDLHIAFNNVAHFVEDPIQPDRTLEAVLRWVRSSDVPSVSLPTPEQSGRLDTSYELATSNEVKMVFPKRSLMRKSWDLRRLISVSNTIECIGISNNEMTLGLDEELLIDTIHRGAKMTLLFLDPKSPHTREREKEEGQQKHTIKNHTNACLSFAFRVVDQLDASEKSSFEILAYDEIPRMNMIFIDAKHLLLQYYATAVAGASNPSFYIQKTGASPVFDFYYRIYHHIKEKAKPARRSS